MKLFNEFRPCLLCDSWDPDNNPMGLGLTNKRYVLKENNGKYSFEDPPFFEFAGDEGQFYKYKNNTGEDVDVLPHIYYNYHTGTIYYPDGKGNYVKHNETIAPGFTASAWDSEINPVARNIIRTLRMNSNPQLALVPNTPTPVENPVYTLVETEQQTEEDKKKEEERQRKIAEHDAYVQQMMLQSLTPVSEENTPTDDTVYYNYGPHQVDMKYLIHNMGTNLQSYLNSKNWNKAQKKAFTQQYDILKLGLQEQLTNKGNRFSTNDAGITADATGAFSTKANRVFITKDGNVYNSLDEIQDKKQRKTAREFSPNDEVAQYLNAIGQAVVKAGKVKGTEASNGAAFDFNQHGFQHYWANKVNPAGGKTDLAPYLNLDMEDETGKRDTKNRAAYLANELEGYLNHIKNQGYNYSGTSYGNQDNYISKLQAAVDNLKNGWNQSDAATLLAAGISPEFYQGFFGNGMTEEEQKQAEEAAKQQEEADKMHAHIVGMLNEYEKWELGNVNNYTEKNPHQITPSVIEQLDDKATGKTLSNVLSRLGYRITPIGSTSDEADKITASEEIAGAFRDLTSQTLTALKSGSNVVNLNVNGTSTQWNISELTKYVIPAMIKLGDFKKDEASGLFYYDDPNTTDNSVLVYNPTTKKLYYTFAYNVQSSAVWQNAKNDYLKSKQKQDGSFRYSFKEGGKLIPKHDAGAKLAELIVGPISKRAEDNNRTFGQQTLKEREMNGQADLMNPENGQWQAEDYTRLAAIGADIVSLAMTPIAATITNLGSSGAHFAADWMDDSVNSTEMWKNLAANVGFDLVSIVPVIGDAAGTGTKLAKSLKWAAPKLMYALAGYGTLATLKNAPNITESLKKVMSDEKLNVGDYQNIAQAISAVVGVGNLAKNKVAKKSAKEQALDSDAFGLKVKNKNTGDTQDLIFKGEKAKQLREAVATNDTTKVNEFLHSLEDQPGMKFSDWEASTSVSSYRPRMLKPWETSTGADGKSSTSGRSPFYMKRQIDSFDVYNGKATGIYSKDWMVDRSRQTGAKQIDYTKAEVDAIQERRIKELTDPAVAATNRRVERTNQLQEELTASKAKYDEAKAKTSTYDDAIAIKQRAFDDASTIRNEGFDRGTISADKVPSKISSLSTRIAREESRLNKLIERKSRETRTTPKADRISEAQIRNQERLVESLREQRTNLQDWESKYGVDAIDALQKDLNGAISDRAKLDSEISLYDRDLGRIRGILDNLNKTRSHATTKLEQTLKNPINILDDAGNPTGRTINRDLTSILEGFKFLKKGGRLLFLKEGDALIGNIGHKEGYNYYQHGLSKWIDNLLSAASSAEDKQKFADNINNMQHRHSGLYSKWNGTQAYRGTDNDVANYQNDIINGYSYVNTNGIGNIRKEGWYIDSKRPYGKDSADQEGNWKADNYYAAQTDDRRVLGRSGDFDENTLTSLQNRFKDAGYEMYLDDTDNYYKLRLPGQTTTIDRSQLEGNPENQVDPGLSGYKGDDNEDKENPNLIGPKLVASGKNALPWLARIGRLGYLNGEADRLANFKAKAVQPYLQDPVEHHRAIYGNLRAKQEGEAAKAQLQSQSSRPLTSDGSLQSAYQMEAAIKGQTYVDAGNKADDQMIRQTSEAAWQQEKENKNNAHNVAMQNRLAIRKAIETKNEILSYAREKKAQNNDAFLQEVIYNLDQKNQERKAMQEQLDMNDLDTAYTYNPTKLGVQFDGIEEQVYNKALNGIPYTSMTAEELQALQSAKQKVMTAKMKARRNYYNLGSSMFAQYRNRDGKLNWEAAITTPTFKKGGQIEVMKIKEKIENAKRFLDSVNKGHDRFTKKMIAKSRRLHTLPKSKVIEAK